MTASILDGKLVAAELRQKIQTQVATDMKRPPGLAVILVGDDPASCIYVNNKQKACREVGFKSELYHYSSNLSQKELLESIDSLNQNPTIDGILVQLPLPKHIDTQAVIERISPIKDVDGFHPYNLGRLAQGNPSLRPCTPLGIMHLLNYYQIPILGKKAVIIGASNIVGRPMALELLLAKATVTICHSATQELEHYVRMADLLIVAAGVCDVIDTNWLHSQQVVIDVGMHRLPNGKLRGDVDFETAKNKVAWLTPVPNGVGPMTISALLHNTLIAATR